MNTGMRMRVPVALLLTLLAACEGSGLSGSPRHDSGDDVDLDPTIDAHDVIHDDPVPDTGLDPSWDMSGDDSVWPDGWVDPWVDADPPCPPPVEDIESVFLIDDNPFPVPPIDMELTCTAAYSGTLVHHIALECGSESHLIEFRPYPPVRVDWPMDMEVVFRYVVLTPSATPYWVNRWFSLERPDGDLIMAGVDADSIAPPGTDDAEWYDPLDPYVPDSGCLWEHLSCYDNERIEIFFDYGSGPPSEFVSVWDHGEGWVGVGNPFLIRVGEASLRRSMSCPETPERWISLVLARQYG
jgi:hypothetical protein